MPIVQTVKGNLLDMFEERRFTAIAHGANCFHTMGAGIAGQIAQRYPFAVKADQWHHVCGDRNALGDYSVDFNVHGTLLNLYTQYRPGRELTVTLYAAIGNAFLKVNADSLPRLDFGVNRGARPLIGIPKIGSGIAGGNWEEIAEIINAATTDLDIVVIEYQP